MNCSCTRSGIRGAPNECRASSPFSVAYLPDVFGPWRRCAIRHGLSGRAAAAAISQQLTWKDKLRFDLWTTNPRSPYTYKRILFEEIDFPV